MKRYSGILKLVLCLLMFRETQHEFCDQVKDWCSIDQITLYSLLFRRSSFVNKILKLSLISVLF